MGVRIPVLVRHLQGFESVQVPLSALAAYFSAWGIDLVFTQGAVLTRDPARDPAVLEQLLLAHAPAGPLPAPALLLVLGLSKNGDRINGQLLDAQRRGICAVFARSRGFGGSADDRFEIFVHELGHLLNLIHDDADAPYATAMDQMDDRAMELDRRKVWRRLIQEAGPGFGSVNAHFGNGSRVPLGLPMSIACGRRLLTPLLADTYPWGSKFRDPDADESEDEGGPVRCSLQPHRPQVSLGEPLAISITVALAPRSRKARRIPAVIGLHEGTLQLSLQGGGHDDLRVFAPRSVRCAHGHRLLRPRETLGKTYTLLADANGLLFPRPGTYRLRARVPALGLASPEVTIAVTRAKSRRFDADFLGFLAGGLPLADTEGWLKAREAMADKAIPGAAKAYIAAEFYARASPGAAQPPWLAEAVSALPRTAQEMAFLRLQRMAESEAGSEAMRACLAATRELLQRDDRRHPMLAPVQALATRLKRAERRD